MGAQKSKIPQDNLLLKEQTANSKKIDREIEKDRQISERGNNVKVLLLGAGEGGKSTILKQMKILHIQGFGEEEIQQYKLIIFSYLLDNMKIILEALPEHNLTLPTHLEREKEVIFSYFENHRSSDIDCIEKDVGNALTSLWNSEKIKNCVASPNHHQLDDSVPYFYNSMDRILSPDYVPSQDDLIRVRVRTTGIVEVNFSVKEKRKHLHFQMFDVAGQRSERRKWIHCFEGVTAVLFVVSLAEYDQRLMEDSSCNRMVESLDLFGTIVNNKFFTLSSFILFLNKRDLFEEKIENSNFSDFFPEYTGDNNELAVKVWIKNKFMAKNKVLDEAGKPKTLYVHYTNATDTNNIKHVFNDVSDIIIKNLLEKEFL
eukprot:GFUD01014055.1.p1 GENE.GFUD01014055.1~~GFUD01014055.1.p1  ORF type:complete len:372 (+),score=89.07 GFUD01014055.1:45-1160(+)